MIDIISTINTIESINNAFLSGKDSREIASRINSIKRKHNDAKLYLAVIGEFSSGKSTFINALLGYRLLKEAVMPTTACATYIECQARYLSLKVSFFNGNKFNCTETEFENLQNYLIRTYSRFCNDLFQIITILTSDQDVAHTVSSLKINIPGNAIPKNIVIIDTPGFNPGTTSTENHQEITKDVVENIADAAIILTSQEQAMSASLSRFLNENFNRSLHRCTYVVTKMDTLEDLSAQKEILDYVQQRIKIDLMVSDPKLFGLSAVTMLPIKKIPKGKEQDWSILQKEFSKFTDITWLELQKSKEYVLSEHINILVKEIVKLCVEKLSVQQKKLQQEKLFLEAHKVETIHNVCNEMVSKASNAIDVALSTIRVSFRTAEKNSKEKSEAIVRSDVNSEASFNSKAIPQINDIVKQEAKTVLSDLNSSINDKVRKCVNTQITEMSKIFKSHYRQFPSLQPTEVIPVVNLIKFSPPKLDFRIAQSEIRALESKENKTTGCSMAAGAGIGAAVGGILGALIGGGIGFVVGAVKGDQTNSIRIEAISIVNNQISLFFTSLRIKVDKETTSIKEKYKNLINGFASEHISHYAASVQDLISDHLNKLQQINVRIDNFRSAVAALQNIQDDIEEELSILKIK
jgi:GTPase Era involved in 16S rRNA processing